MIDRLKGYILGDKKAIAVFTLSVAFRSFDLYIERKREGAEHLVGYKGDSLVLLALLLPPYLNPTGITNLHEVLECAGYSESKIYSVLSFLEERKLLRVLNRRAIKGSWMYTIMRGGLEVIEGYMSFLFMDSKAICILNELD
jgi:hypothetical protein